MNILVFSQYFWPENFRINDLVKALMAKGVTVDVVTGQPNYPDGHVFDGYRAGAFTKHSWSDATVYRLPLIPRGRGSAVQLICNYLSFVLSGILLAPFALRRKRVDVVFVYAISPILQAIPAIVLKWIKGAKLVIWVQDLWPESLEATGFVRNRWILAMVGVVVRWIYRQADLILVQSEAFVEPVAALADRKKICYYPNSADDVFSSSSVSENCPIDGLNDGFSVVFAGNLGSAQSVETIIEAAALLQDAPDIRIFLVGDGSRADWVHDEIQMRGLKNVVMAGRHSLESMPAILSGSGALLVTLRDEPIFYHTVPSKVQAYLAMGRPIIACVNGEGARIIMEADAGISCPAEDAASLAVAIKQLSNMTTEERKRLGENGQRYFQTHYDSGMLTQTLISHFENLIASGRD
ncbi:glycosyltransferase family 4 protein [Collimonas sp.]|uniref:glycosyltransferase family 4 protein n=1 Tax=Collimonas sp. TaxID=1963772 RepID=UPI002C617F34|nr:glycosyltransferase family 4 protein [Collimonas sp.]HWW04950.1 glycosyltransferase family 4 protein [Collimonas sp.]